MVKRASVFLNRIKSLKDQQWEDIYEAALDTSDGNKLVELGEKDYEDDVGGEVAASDDDAELGHLVVYSRQTGHKKDNRKVPKKVTAVSLI